MKKNYLTADDIAKELGISKPTAYVIIRQCNEELKEQGYLTIAGKIPTAYFAKKWFGYDKAKL